MKILKVGHAYYGADGVPFIDGWAFKGTGPLPTFEELQRIAANAPTMEAMDTAINQAVAATSGLTDKQLETCIATEHVDEPVTLWRTVKAMFLRS